MQNAITYALRQVRPNRVFLPTSADLHPDHQIVHEEMLISLFHAQGNIWPELGPPIAEVPKVYEFACLLRFSPTAADPHRNAAGHARNQAPSDSWPMPARSRSSRSCRFSATWDRSSISASWSSISTHPQTISRRCSRRSRDACEDLLPGRRLAWSGAASYLAAIMLHDGLGVRPCAAATSRRRPTLLSEPYALYVVSDYPAGRFGAAAMTAVADCVERGSGLVMLGGWESFFGRAGEYHQSPLADVLPVAMQQADDRRNCAQPCLIHKVAEHPILEGLPWDQPPGIGGLNVIDGQAGAETLLTAVPFAVRRRRADKFEFHRGKELPLAGRRAARPGPHGGAGHRRGAALGRRAGRLGRPAGHAGSRRRVQSRSATGTPGSSATCWCGRHNSR